MPLTRTLNLNSRKNAGSGYTNLDPITYNNRYPGLDEYNYKKLDTKVSSLGLTGYEKEQAMDEAYKQVLPIVQTQIKNSDRRKYINQAEYEVSQMPEGDAKKLATGKLTVVGLTQLVKEKYNIDPSAPDEQVFNDWLATIPNGVTLLEDYMNNGDRTLLYQSGLVEPATTKEMPETSVGGIQSIINEQSKVSGDTTAGKVWNAMDWLNPVGKLTQWADNLVQRIPVVDGSSQAQNLANKINNLSEDEISTLYNRYLKMVENGTSDKWKNDDRGWVDLIWDGLINGDKDALDRVNTLKIADYSDALKQTGIEENQWGNQLWDTMGSEDLTVNENDNLLDKVSKKSQQYTKNLLNFIGGSWGGLENYADAAGVASVELKDLAKGKDAYYAPIKGQLENDENAFNAYVANQTANFGEYIMDAPDMILGESVSPNVGKMLVNTPASFLKTLSSKIRGKTNPADSKVGLLKMLFTEDGQQAMINRYGSIENIANTMNSDPIGLASDIIDWGDKINWVFNKASGGNIARQDFRDVTDVLSEDAVKGINQGMNYTSNWLRGKGRNFGANVVDLSRKSMNVDPVNEVKQMVKDPNAYAQSLGQTTRETLDTINPLNKENRDWLLKRANNKVQNMNRMTTKQQEKFKDMIGEDVGEYMNKRKYRNVDDTGNALLKNLDQVDEAMATIEGRYKSKELDTVLNDVLKHATDVEDPNLQKWQDLYNKNKEGGLEMDEINEVKRYYERNNIFTYLKEGKSKKATKLTNRDTALRKWQLSIAEEAGLDNLKELNKETQALKFITDNATDWQDGRKGNNDITLTDWIVAAGGGMSPQSILTMVGKQVYSSSWFQNKMVDVMNYLGGREYEEGPKVDMEKIKQANVNRAILAEELSRVKNEEEFNNWLNRAKLVTEALPYNPQYDNQEPIDYTTPTKITPEGQSIRYGQIDEINNNPERVRDSYLQEGEDSYNAKRNNLVNDEQNMNKVKFYTAEELGLPPVSKTMLDNLDRSKYGVVEDPNTGEVQFYVVDELTKQVPITQNGRQITWDEEKEITTPGKRPRVDRPEASNDVEFSLTDELQPANLPRDIEYINQDGEWLKGTDDETLIRIAYPDTFEQYDTDSLSDIQNGKMDILSDSGMMKVNYNDGYVNIDLMYEPTEEQIDGLRAIAENDEVKHVQINILDPQAKHTIRINDLDSMQETIDYINDYFGNNGSNLFETTTKTDSDREYDPYIYRTYDEGESWMDRHLAGFN